MRSLISDELFESKVGKCFLKGSGIKIFWSVELNDPSILMICWLKMTVCKPVLHSFLMILFISTWRTRTQTNSTWHNHCGGGNRPVGKRGMFPIENSFLRNCTQIRPTHAECFISETSREPEYGGLYQEKLMTQTSHPPTVWGTPEIHVLGGNIKPILVF